MYTVKNIEPGILELQQQHISWNKTTYDTMYYVRLDGTWFRIHNDRLITAQNAVAGKLTDLEKPYVLEVTGDSLAWLEKNYLPKLEGEFI